MRDPVVVVQKEYREGEIWGRVAMRLPVYSDWMTKTEAYMRNHDTKDQPEP